MKAQASRKQCFNTILISLGIWAFSLLLSVPLLVYYDTSMLYVAKVSYSNDKRYKTAGWTLITLYHLRFFAHLQCSIADFAVGRFMIVYIVTHQRVKKDTNHTDVLPVDS